ncbi:MAG: hypothetical protein JXA21_20665 [Anaerolineae bacterium]|nr:hypothetical protein [Anaerolineae bacterium]
MDNLPRKELAKIVKQYGQQVTQDSQKCKAYLMDHCGKYQLEINVLTTAQFLIVSGLQSPHKDVPISTLLSRLTKQVVEEYGLSQENARWAVESWAIALGKEIPPSSPKKMSWKGAILILLLLIVASVIWFIYRTINKGQLPVATTQTSSTSEFTATPITAIPPTETSIPPTETPIPPTDTPIPPTETSVPPTNTPIPPTSTNTPQPPTPTATFTPEPEPPDDGMKSIGEGYSANGVSVILKDYSIGSSDINLRFVVKNESTGSMTIRYQNSYFELYDDTGRKYDHDVGCEYDTKQRQFEPGNTVTLYDAGGCFFEGIDDFEGVIGQDVSYLIVKVSQFMDLQDMQWRIDLMPPTSSAQNPSPGGILSLKEGFSANGVSLILTDYSIGSSDINLKFVVKNESNGRMLIRFQNSYFEVYDDLGNQYEHDVGCLQDTKQRQFEPGDTVTLYDAGGCFFEGVDDFEGGIGQNASYLIVKVSKFMDLQDMQWRIDLMPPTSSEQNPSPGTILSLGEGFSANGVSLTLTDYSIGSSDINLKFVVKNGSNGRMLIRFQNSYFEVHDDLGNQYEHDVGCLQDTKQRQFEPGDTVTLYDAGGCFFEGIDDFEGVIDQNASYLIVKVSQFMDLQDMQWRIDF